MCVCLGICMRIHRRGQSVRKTCERLSVANGSGDVAPLLQEAPAPICIYSGSAETKDSRALREDNLSTALKRAEITFQLCNWMRGYENLEIEGQKEKEKDMQYLSAGWFWKRREKCSFNFTLSVKMLALK